MVINTSYLWTYMIYTAPYVMLLMRADTLQGEMGGGWALEIETFEGHFEGAKTVLTS